MVLSKIGRALLGGAMGSKAMQRLMIAAGSLLLVFGGSETAWAQATRDGNGSHMMGSGWGWGDGSYGMGGFGGIGILVLALVVVAIAVLAFRHRKP